jgi:ERCC4-related helicase
MLQAATRYDRMAGYFSSSSLASAAQGLEPFIARGGHIRLVVNHHLADDDVAAVERGLELREAVQSRLSRIALTIDTDFDPDAPTRLRWLCSLVALGQLDVKVAVPCAADGRPLKASETTDLHHSKFGVFTDGDGEKVTFEGSNNESSRGWSSNYETYAVYPSWKPSAWTDYGEGIVADFERHWSGVPPLGWAVVDLPDAARDGLIAKADPDLIRDALEAQGRLDELEAIIARILAARGEAPATAATDDIAALLATPSAHPGVGVGTSAVLPWPHQYDVARKVIAAWPTSAMFSDEVGLGKTIEVGLVLRELLVSGRVRRALVLVPASVLWQWQTELWEKFTLAIPVLDGARLVWPEGASPGERREEPLTGDRWDAADVMLASSHLARRASERPKLFERRWDLVVVDEAHHARRRGSKATKDDPNALLQLLRRMRDRGCWDGLLLASATPMQMHAHEAYDLLAVLGLPGAPADEPDATSWRDAGAVGFTQYYDQLTREDAESRDWKLLRSLNRSHHAIWSHTNPHLERSVEHAADDGLITLGEAKAIVRFADTIADRKYRRFTSASLSYLDAWLREHTPMRTLVHRNTRHLLRAYQESGIIAADVVIPVRHVRDLHVTFDAAEQELYDRIESWIRDKYQKVAEAGAKDNKAKAVGFIMTVYRRRLTSSFRAIELSLIKRRDKLRDQKNGILDLASLLDDDDRTALGDVPDELEALLETDDAAKSLTEAVGSTQDELDELDEFIEALGDRPKYDSKLQALINDLQKEFGHSKPDGGDRQAIVFTQFTDTMDALRAQLAQIWPGKVACYSGRGGEVHEPGPAGGTWTTISKGELKDRFWRGEFRLLLGTDAMSEGLNLQKCDLLYNLDLPWNFMRIEQRIGRIDRIGGHPDVHVVNMLIDGTVEERIYSGIKDDFGDFESIVGAAQPVLAQTEDAIREAVFAQGPDRDELLAQQAQALIAAAKDAAAAPVSLDTFQAQPDAWRPASPLAGEHAEGGESWLEVLERSLTGHPVYGERFQRLDGRLWRYAGDRGEEWAVTFDLETADASAGQIGLFVWGHPAFPGPESLGA